MIWMGQGGPPVTSPPDQVGFGSKLVERSVSRHLGGSIDYDWSNGGPIATLRVDRAKLTS